MCNREVSMSSLPDYFSDISAQLCIESERIRNFFSSHRPTAGENREDLVAKFLSNHLPKKFGISSGLIVSKEGQFSNQADVIISDQINNAPLFSTSAQPIWLVESVFSLIEVKTQLTPSTLKDSVEKCRKFKLLNRDYSSLAQQNITESLFVLWAFEGPKPETAKINIESAFKDVPQSERPDFIIVPGSILVRSGHYYELSTIGQAGSQHREQLRQRHNGNEELLLGNGIEVADLGQNALLAFITWYSSWLLGAGSRSAPLQQYLSSSQVFGSVV